MYNRKGPAIKCAFTEKGSFKLKNNNNNANNHNNNNNDKMMMSITKVIITNK